jgi:hypothetical protein
MAACTSVTARNVIPNSNVSMQVVTYSKANTGDFLTIGSPVMVVRHVIANKTSSGAEDPCAVSASLKITFSAGTSAGNALVIGTCQ